MMSAAAIRGQPLRAGQQRRAAAGRRTAVQTQALFGFLAPPKAKASPSRANELVSELLELSERTQGGLNASGARREQIAELVEELEGFCPRSPLRNPLLYGDYEVVYTSKPTAAGGPYRTLPGRIVFPGQRPLQSIVEPNVLVNVVEYKALGFLPGRVTQEGEIKAVSNDTFELTFANDGRRGPVTRLIQIVYLDDRVRVARSIPGDDAEGAIFVFKRLGVEEKEEEEEEEVYEEEEEEVAPPKRGGFSFGTRRIKAAAQEEEEEEEAPRARAFGTQLLGRREGLATMAERRYAQQQGSRGTGTAARGGSQGTGTQARKSREEIAAERAAAKAAAEEERRAAREAAAAAKAAAEEERRRAKEQQEAERARQAELREKAKEQLAALQGEAAAAADEAKEAAAAVKEAEKAASELLRQAGQARGLIDQAAAATAAALQQVEALKGAEAEAAAELADARNLIKQLGRK